MTLVITFPESLKCRCRIADSQRNSILIPRRKIANERLSQRLDTVPKKRFEGKVSVHCDSVKGSLLESLLLDEWREIGRKSCTDHALARHFLTADCPVWLALPGHAHSSILPVAVALSYRIRSAILWLCERKSSRVELSHEPQNRFHASKVSSVVFHNDRVGNTCFVQL